MSKKSGCTLIIVIIVVLVIALLAEQTKNKKKLDKALPISVVTAEVIEGPIKQSLEFTGTLEGKEQADIVSQTSGVIQKLLFSIGQSCKAGQTLVEVENRQQQAAYDQAEAQVMAAQASYDKAQSDLTRIQKLYDGNVTTKDNLESAQLGARSAYAGLKSAQAGLEAARKQLDDTRIVSPISGRVGNRAINLGQTVTPGTVIATVVNDSEFLLKLLIPETNISKIKTGQDVTITVDAISERTFKGRVRNVGAAFEKDGTSYPVELVVPRNGDPDLKSGMFSRCVIATESKDSAMLVPSNAILQLNNQNYVYVAKDGHAAMQQVEVGLRNSEFTEILSGLQMGTKVITIGKEQVTDGAIIQ